MDRILPLTKEHNLFRTVFGRFLDKEIVPYYNQWEKDHIVPRHIYKKFGDHGFLCAWADEKYGGSEADFLYSVIQIEETGLRGLNGLFTRLHSDIVAHYIYSYGTEEQKERWFNDIVSGDKILAVAMTEPEAGSDLQAIRTRAVKKGDCWLLNGSKTFISNGINADLIIVAAKTDFNIKPAYRGISLFVVERGTPGFTRGNPIAKIGLQSQDTAELFFDNCIIPQENLLGEEGKGFNYLMEKLQQERLIATIVALSNAERCLNLAIQYTKERKLFGQPLSKFQNTQFELAKTATEIELARSFVDQLIIEHMKQKDIVKEVSMAKYYCSELSFRTADRCLQLFGGYGYCEEYPIAKMFVDSRVHRIYAGTSEVMLTIIAKKLGL